MRLRTLKKLSKRAVPYLSPLGDRRAVFLSDGENHVSGVYSDTRDAERWSSANGDKKWSRCLAVLAPRCRAGAPLPFVKVVHGCYAPKGTPMVGAYCGGEEPEWEEEAAYEALVNNLVGLFFVYDPATDTATCTRDFSSPRKVFAAADEIIATRCNAEGDHHARPS